MSRIPTFLIALSLTGAASFAFAQTPDAPAAAQSAPIDAAAAAAAVPPTSAEEKSFTLFRHDLINLLILRTDPRLLTAAAQIAAPDASDAKRLEEKKTPSLLQRALKFGPQDTLVLWVAASNACLTKPGCADLEALKTLQTIDADNAAVWLLSYPTDNNAQKAQGIIARMAQAPRYNEYWAADVVALYHALETLPVPEDVTRQGVSSQAARVNFATSIASAILPKQLQGLSKICSSAKKDDAAFVSDCIAVARKLETGGTFASRDIGFGIEEALLAPGVDRDVMLSRKRSAAWQKEQFFGLSARFAREPALADSYVRLLGSDQNELYTVTALMREQNLRTDPPAGWKPAEAPKGVDPLSAPATQP